MGGQAIIYQITAKTLFQLNRTNPHTATYCDEIDISHTCQFVGWYEWVSHIKRNALDNAMAQWVLQPTGKKVYELSPGNTSESKTRKDFGTATSLLGDSLSVSLMKSPCEPWPCDPNDDGYDFEP
jgi:hypothetical protein